MEPVVRRISGADWPALRAVRLQALAESPEQFAATLADNEARSDAAWQTLAEGPGPRVLAFSDSEPVAMGGLYVPGDEEISVWGMWVAPAWRGRGLGSRILRALLEAAREEHRPVVLHVAEGNDAARRMYEAHGFVSTGEWQPLRADSPRRVETMRWRG